MVVNGNYRQTPDVTGTVELHFSGGTVLIVMKDDVWNTANPHRKSVVFEISRKLLEDLIDKGLEQ